MRTAWRDRRRKRTPATRRKQSAQFKPLAEAVGNVRVPTYFDLDTFAQAVEVNIWVYASNYRLAKTLAAVKFRITKRGTDETAEGPKVKRLRELLYRVNPEQTWFDFAMANFLHLGLDGETYSEMARNRLREVAELHLIVPQSVEAIPDPTGKLLISEYLVTIGAKEIRLPAADVIPCRDYNPRNRYRGMSPIAPIRREIAADVEAANYNLALLREGARVGGVLSPTDGDLDPEGYERLKAELKKAHSGSDKAGRFLLVPNGFQFTPDGVSMKDMDFINLRKLSREAAASSAGVAPMMIQNFDSATYANAEQQLRAFWDYTGKPMLKQFYGALNEHLVHKEISDEIEIQPDLVGIDAQIDSEKTRVENTGKMLQGGIITINEARLRVGYAPLPDGDKLLVQGALVPMDPSRIEMEPRAPAPQPPSGGMDDGAGMPRGTPEDGMEGMDEETRAAPGPGIRNRLASLNGHKVSRSEVEKEIMRLAHDLTLREAETALERQAASVLRQHRAKILARLEEVGEAVTAEHLMPSPEGDARWMWERLSPAVVDAIAAGGRGTLRRLGLAEERSASCWAVVRKDGRKVVARGNFDIGNPRIVEYLRTYLFRHVRKIVDVTREALERMLDEVRASIAAGQGVSELTERIRNLPELSETRAERVARTETVSAYNFGAQEAFEQAQTPRKSWLTTQDERVRESHAEAEKATSEHPIKTGDAFVLQEAERGTAAVMFPGDPAGPGWTAVNCRCALVPEGDEERAAFVAQCKREVSVRHELVTP